MTVRIAIIGAGFAGVSTAKTLSSLGYSVSVFEKESEVGGVWASSRRYPGLTTQNPRSTYALSDFPMPDDYPEWPSGEQVQRYFEDYITRFKLRKLIRFNTMVTAAELSADQSYWTVTSKDANGSGDDLKEEFDYLIICNGIFSTPSIPQYSGVDDWKAAGGEIVHTCQYTDLESVRDKNVVVIGYGKSSCDAAVATLGVSKSTTVLARNLIWKIPKKIAGVLNFKHLFLTRLGEGLFPYIELNGFEKFLHGTGRPIRNAMLATVEAIIAAQLKLKKIGLHPGKPLETIARSTVSLVTPGFYEAIEKGTLAVKREAEIVALRPGHAELSTGEVIPADYIIAGTGWIQHVPFLPKDLMAKITDTNGDFRLYRSMLPVGVPRLAFNGYNSSFFSQLSCEAGAMWIAEYLRGAIEVPSVSEQKVDIDRRLCWMRERTDGKHCRGTNIVPFSLHHIDELLDEAELNVSSRVKFTQWFSAVDPSVYAKNYEILEARAMTSSQKE
ncbi:flavin-containing monooxygenase [Hyphococcus sp. DH-69]|uniref:flavin-containing monooxygenase n=1 Tax=Hyphococcus formosus TaxID=3143534 RepID=UPI00398B567C